MSLEEKAGESNRFLSIVQWWYTECILNMMIWLCAIETQVLCIHCASFSLTYACGIFQEVQDKMISLEKAEEAKLKARYPNLGNKPGGSDLLRKRLQKGVSYLLCWSTDESGFTNGQSPNPSEPLFIEK